MKYSVETTENGYVETLEVDGKEYKKTWTHNGIGSFSCDDYEFHEQLEKDGFDDEELLEDVFNYIDGLSVGIDVFDISMIL